MNTQHRLLTILLGTAMLVGALVGRADAATIVITPTDDDRGLDGNLSGNFVCCPFDVGIATIAINLVSEERVALEFALGAIPSGSIITSATLTLYNFAAVMAVNTADVHGYAGDGTITAADMTVSNLLASFPVSGAGAIGVPLGPGFIQSLLTAQEDFAGFMLRNVTNPTGVFSIYTVDSLASEFDPTLTIEYEVVPEPGSLLLVASALALSSRRLRRGVRGRIYRRYSASA